MDRDLMHLRDSLIPRYAELIYYGSGMLRKESHSKPSSMKVKKKFPAPYG